MSFRPNTIWKYRIISFASIGLLLIGAGLFLLIAPPPVHSQIDDAEYVGSSECGDCHRGTERLHADTRHALTLQEPDSDNVLADFSQEDAVRQVQFPDEDAPRLFTEDDIAFVVGSGRYVQRYLYEVERNQYQVFPAEWNVAEQKWEAYSLAENWLDPAYDWNQNCAGCHTTGLDPERGRWEDDAVQCESCHGPGSLHLEAVDDDEDLEVIRASIILSPDAQVCGACHSQGVESGDNRPYPVNYRPGGDLAQTFTLSPPDDSAHWRSSGHAASQNMQYNEWLFSRHAQSLESVKSSTYGEDSCLTCHSADYQMTEQMRAAVEAGEREGTAPEMVTLETAQFGVTCTSCHDMHAQEAQDFQLSAEPYALCISCHADDRLEQVHNPVKEMFEGEIVIEQISGVPSKHFTEGATCTDCHMPLTLETGLTWHTGSHTMQPVFPGEASESQPDSCTGCHTDLSREYMQRFVDETQSGILQRLTDAQAALESETAPPPWVLEALQVVSNDGSLGIHNFSYTSTLLDTAALELGVVQSTIPSNVSTRPVENPTDCAECHMDEYRQWQTSPHANASLGESFQNEFAAQGRPSFCMSCHASGYDPRTEAFVFEGVVCSSCHYVTGSSEHPPGPVEVATDSAVCGTCHSGEHAPTYGEWLVSSHSVAGIDCVDCHTPHNNGLLLDDVNSTCESCHTEAKTDDIHMGQDMTCVDCHMAKREQQNGIFNVQTGHSMLIDPGICANCHGNIHLLSAGEAHLSEQEQSQLALLESELTQLQTTATDNLNTGIVGGAIGALVLVVIVYVVIRLGRRR
jgi:predicted CXXCH cytochrome family protein